MSFPRYPKYKDSGVEWLGQVPEHWSPKKFGAVSSLKGRLGWQGLKADEYRDEGPYVVSSAHFDNHRIQWDECPRVSQERYHTDTNIQLAANDVLLMKDGAAMGKLAFIDRLPGPACLNSHLLLFRPIMIDGVATYSPRFAFYFMQTGYFQEHIKVNGTGATFLGISQDAIGRYQIVLPPLPEQTAIAAFLDRETAKIDALVAEQQRLMELLKEKRQAVISHAVTKGLNPKAPLKPSGIEWLGDVPAHWDVKRIKSLCSIISKGTTPSLVGAEFTTSGVRFLKAENVTESGVSEEPEFFISEEAHEILSRGSLQDQDVLVVIAGATTGKSAVLNKSFLPANTNQAVSYVRLKDKRFSHHVSLWLGTRLVRNWILLNSVQSAQPNLSMEDLGNIPIPIPPPPELSEITAFLTRETARFDTLTAEAQRAIDLLQERRTALISAAVTGQIDVREHSTKEHA